MHCGCQLLSDMSFFFFSSRRRHTRCSRDWSSDVCSSDLIGLPEAQLGLLPGAGGTQRLPRTIGMPAALLHILMGVPLTPRDAERKGLVHETVSGKALDRAMDIARRLASHPPAAVAHIKRLVRNASETPLAQGLALERNLFLKLCISEPALARMRSYVEANITSPSRSIVVEGD